MIPDWQLPSGVDRGLWDYMQSPEMVAGYDAQMQASPLARTDVAFCEKHFPTQGRLIDLGCGTGRLAVHFNRRGFDCVGVDLSEEMLQQARRAESTVQWMHANLVELDLPASSFDYAACLFSTLGMLRSAESRRTAVENAFRVLKTGGVLIVHVHHRWHSSLGLRRFLRCDFTMPQAYGGAPLTLHHFSKREILTLLRSVGFTIREVQTITLNDKPATMSWRVHGFLVAAVK